MPEKSRVYKNKAKLLGQGVSKVRGGIRQVLNDLELETIWGISKGWANRLKKIGINNALQLQRANPNHIKQHISVVGKRIVYELRGISALDLEQVHSKKSITVSRSFGETVTDLQSLKEALSKQDDINANTFKDLINNIKTEHAISGNIWKPIRMALTGSEHGPDISSYASILGSKTCLNRIQLFLDLNVD